MVNANYTAVMLLVDRSGSMQSIRAAAEDGVNEFVNSLKRSEGKRTIRIAQFDYHHTEGMRYTTVCPSTEPAAVDRFELDPRGTTPLLDAMAKSIIEFGEELAALPEDQRPGVVIFAVMTDGHENASREFTWAQITGMVKRHESDYGWQVVYLGANQDAIEVAEKLGVAARNSMTYVATEHGTRSATQSLTSYVYAAAAGESIGFTDEQRKDAVK
jgi:Mg-chelatase subunit ChlD